MQDTAEQDSQTWRIAAGIVAALALAGAVVWYLNRPATAPAPVAPPPPQAEAAPAPPAPTDAATPPVEHPLEPVPGTAAEDPAATPVDADALAQAGLEEVFGTEPFAAWLVPGQLVRRLVATTDNLARDVRTEPLRPLRPPGGTLAVEREVLDATVGTERITLAAANAARYDPYVSLLARTDMAAAATVYRRLYPLLQRAYEDLGYPAGYFNDRVVEVIDHLLATPEPEGLLLLEQPKVLYRFADADLESRSAGQKLLLRMGVAHARTVKQKLGEFREQVASKE